jgi:uncharacterized membrane protein YhaH (DUF805 family)
MGVVTGTLLLLSVLVPNGSTFVRRARDVLRRRELRGSTAALTGEKTS